ncbi:hypothetical protein V8B97DRAFT_2054408 [Scleroderma yunnanense]
MKSLSSSRFQLSFARFGVSSPFDPTFAFVTSSLPFLHPSALAAVRSLFAVYALITAVVILGFEASVYGGGPSYLSYFTNLSYIGLCAYFCASGVQTIAFARALKGLRDVQDDAQAIGTRRKESGRVERRRIAYPLQTWPRVFQLMHVLLYTSIVIYRESLRLHVLSPILWAVVLMKLVLRVTQTAPSSSVSRHDCVLGTTFEFLILGEWISGMDNRIPPYSQRCLCTLRGYLHECSPTPMVSHPYSFLDPGKHPGLIAVYVCGITLGYCIIFAIVKGVITLRCRLSGRYWGSREDEERQGEPEALNEWEEVESPQQQSSAPRL